MPKLHSSFIALKYRDFRLLWGGSFISQMGDQMQTVAIAWQLYELTHNAASLGLIGISGFIPIILFSMIGGLSADKVNRKKLLVTCQTILTALAVILFVTTSTKTITPWIIYGVLAIASAVQTFNNPARQSIVVNLVPREIFINAVSLNTLQRQTATIIGPAIAGFMIAFWGVNSVYLFNAISFIAMIGAFLLINMPPTQTKKVVTFSVQSVKEGIQFVVSKQVLLSTMLLDFLASFFGTANILMPIFAKDVLGVGAEGLGFLYSAPAVGGVAAGLYFANKHKLPNQGKIIIGCTLVYGLTIIGFGLSKAYYLSLFFLTIMGMTDMASTILRNTLRQLLTPDHIRGRMVSINMLFVRGGPQLGDAEAGFLSHLVGAPVATIIGGAGAFLTTLLVAKFFPKLQKYNGHHEIEI